MPRKTKKLPRFRSEKEEREFWLSHDSADYFDLSRAKPAIFPELKATTRTISLRISEILLSEIKALASKRGVPYQSLMKIILAERVREEVRAG
jgi:predicted DNA binding CopG/RHH family protein